MRAWFKQLDLIKRLLVIAVLITIGGAGLLACFAPLAPWLWLGWIYGASAILISHVWRIKLLKWSFKEHYGKWLGGILGALSLYITLIWIAALLVVLIVVNNIYANLAPFTPSLKAMVNGPLNLYTFLAGLSTLFIAVVVGYGYAKKRER